MILPEVGNIKENRREKNMHEHKINQNKEKIIYLEVCRIIALFGAMYQCSAGMRCLALGGIFAR